MCAGWLNLINQVFFKMASALRVCGLNGERTDVEPSANLPKVSQSFAHAHADGIVK